MEPVIALTAVGLFGGSYVLVYLVTRRVLARIGEVIIKSNDARFKSVHEVMTSIKDVKILGVERPFLQRFCEPTRRMAVVQAQGAVISEAPRYLLEAMALGGMLVLDPAPAVQRLGHPRRHPADLGHLRLRRHAAVPGAADDLPRARHAPGVEARRRRALRRHDGDPRGALGQPAAAGPRLALADRLELDAVAYAYPAASRTALSRPRPQGPGALDARHRRRHRRRQDHARRRDPRPALARRRARSGSTASRSPGRTCAPGRTTSATCRSKSR